jgi:hypothetical protein
MLKWWLASFGTLKKAFKAGKATPTAIKVSKKLVKS